MSSTRKYCKILHCENFHGCTNENIRFFGCAFWTFFNWFHSFIWASYLFIFSWGVQRRTVVLCTVAVVESNFINIIINYYHVLTYYDDRNPHQASNQSRWIVENKMKLFWKVWFVMSDIAQCNMAKYGGKLLRTIFWMCISFLFSAIHFN